MGVHMRISARECWRMRLLLSRRLIWVRNNDRISYGQLIVQQQCGEIILAVGLLLSSSPPPPLLPIVVIHPLFTSVN